MTLLSTFPGEIAALASAFIWAIASSVYARLGQQLSPLILNLTKGGLAIAMILLTFLLRGEGIPQVPGGAIALLLMSGFIGIGLGDTAFFASLNCIGARRGLLLESLAPPIAALIALIALQEILSPLAWLGIVLTVAGVSWVVIERTPDAPTHQLRLKRGVGFGLLAAFAQATGAVLSRAALTGSDISPLWSTLVRLVGGISILIVWMVWQRQGGDVVKVGRSPRLLAIIAGTALAGTYGGIWLQQTALKYTAAGIAQSLGATSPLFVIPIAMWMGDRTSPRAFLGVFVALAGIWLLFQT
jgi:drug/metabolite transporter (DMT)-like permease